MPLESMSRKMNPPILIPGHLIFSLYLLFQYLKLSPQSVFHSQNKKSFQRKNLKLPPREASLVLPSEIQHNHPNPLNHHSLLSNPNFSLRSSRSLNSVYLNPRGLKRKGEEQDSERDADMTEPFSIFCQNFLLYFLTDFFFPITMVLSQHRCVK